MTPKVLDTKTFGSVRKNDYLNKEDRAMGTNQQTKSVAFCCPHHGVLKGTPEYFSAEFGLKELVDISVMYCAACGKYYTPFTNLLALKQLRYHGREVAASQGRVEKSVPRELVRVPYFADADKMTTRNKENNPSRNRKQRRINRYEIVPVNGLNRSAFVRKVILTNYSCDECFKCNNRLVDFVNFIELGENEGVKAPGKYCTKCDTFYESRGSSLKNLLDSYTAPASYSVETEYLFPKYSERIRVLRSLRSISLVIHLKNQNSNGHRLIGIVTSRAERNLEGDVLHYSDWLARRLLFAVYQKSFTLAIAGEEFEILKTLRLDWENENYLNSLKIDTIVLRKGGGLYKGLSQQEADLIDILLYSPFTGCFEVAHASHDKEHNIFYMDAKVFRSFVEKYGNPGVKIAAYQSGASDFSTLRDESILHAYGYVVGNTGLPTQSRQALLGEVMDLGMMSSQSILNLLELNISTHTGEKNANARACWESDKQFVMSYKVNPERFVVATIGL